MSTKKVDSVYCIYYQAHVNRELCWFVTASLRSYEHVAFDRTIDVTHSIFEFFVSPSTNDYFLAIMSYFQQRGIVNNLIELPNRFIIDDV